MTFVVVATGNHWWLDARLRRALVAGVSAWTRVGAFARARPEAWAFRHGVREAT